MERLWTIKEVAEYLKVTTTTVNQWITDKKLKAFKIGGAVRIKETDLIEFTSKER